MCGRYTLSNTAGVQARFEIAQAEQPLTPRFNVAPTQAMPVVLKNSPNRLEWMKWGLVPFWSKEPKSSYSTINARAEGITEKPAYRKPIKNQRCIIPADGFYEWQKTGTSKQPFYIHLKNGELFGFAGLYDLYKNPDGSVLKTYTIITTEANELMADIHDRMPVILHPGDEELWLDPGITDPAQILPLLKPYPAQEMALYPVSRLVNKPENDVPETLQAVS